jgi:hypothetical protein
LQISTFEPLAQLSVLGFLQISVNHENVGSLSALKNLFVVNLNVVGSHKRESLILTMPRVWVLNNKYITLQERKKIFKSSHQLASDLPQQTKAITEHGAEELSESTQSPKTLRKQTALERKSFSQQINEPEEDSRASKGSLGGGLNQTAENQEQVKVQVKERQGGPTPPPPSVVSERAQEFIQHFGQKEHLEKYYMCSQDVPFDSNDFYDFEEKRLYYIVSNLDYCCELEWNLNEG